MTTDLNARVCAALRSYMEEQGVSQAAIARHIGRSTAYVSKRMSGKYDLTLDIVAAVADLTHLSAYALMAELTARMSPAR